MDFKQLESFVTISKYNSFSKASRELYLTQPTLSNHIQNLERELNVSLFDRKGKTIELTTAGKIFRDYAIELIKKRDTAIFRINDLIGQFKGTLELPCSTVPGETIVPKLMSEFMKKYPGIRFKLHHLDSQDVIDGILEKKFTLGFVGIKPNNDFESLKIYTDDMVVIGPSQPCFDSSHIEMSQLIQLPLIVREEGSGSGSILSKELKKRGLSYENLHVIAVSESFHITKKMVSASAGFALVPRSFSKEIAPTEGILTYNLSDVDTKRSFYYICHKKAVCSPLENQFKEFVEQYFKG